MNHCIVIGRSIFASSLRIAAALGFAMLAAPSSAEEYLLAPDDVLQITVVEHQQSSGAYKIGADGLVSVPGIGALTAAGETPRSFESKLVDLASEVFVAPAISVQVLEYRPIYVLGDVREPDKYSYSPSLTVMQAVALAKGFGRPVEGDRFTRSYTYLRSRQALHESAIELAGAQVRQARLRAEIAGAGEFSFTPPDNQEFAVDGIEDMIAREALVFETRRDSFTKRRARIEATLEARRQETQSYDEQIATQEQLLESITDEVKNVRKLREQGLVSTTRLSDLVRAEISTRAQVLQIRSLQRQSAVDERQTEQELVALTEDRNVQIRQELQSVSETVSRLKARLTGEAGILAASGSDQWNVAKINFSFQLYRDGARVGAPTTLTTHIRPGDTLLVIRNDDYARTN
ncbi:polysaccharide biosynthesis/export family protein [Aquicoccus sp. G2-2]|uniref:polysaccharide biosynthesis/export family protein n=1 Tax=Aquicoccus sp. G2-2 TaxID=3092120 RepID=UPI002AE0989D|nr:polysaccharide biosynthesis/export family protein [Aquicoccus sp. G2-2]MEA1114604.1 polysaccharide biosynthesis/export family protein [Aquicoccus sp. G2-2]